ncbi:MAG: ABC transporter substrate-binding protein [Desulfobacterales bacterium]|jgi:NitT/TauT family transport system substrate-binding protein
MMPKSIGFLWVAVLAALSTGASPVAAGNDVLRFGVLPVVDTLPLLVGESEGLFAAEAIDLQMVSFQSALERDAALQAKKLDGYFGDLLNTILLIRGGHPLKIITTAYHTHPDHRMFGIAAGPGSGVRSIRDLAHHHVAISRATIIEYLLDRMAEREGLPVGSVAKQEIKKIPIRLQMLLADQVPAALLPEPLLTLSESKGARVIGDDRHLDTAETVLAMEMTGKTNGLVTRFLTAYGKAVARINARPDAYQDLLVEKTRFPIPVKDRYRVPEFPAVGSPSEADVAAVQDWLVASGMMTDRLRYGEIVYTP